MKRKRTRERLDTTQLADGKALELLLDGEDYVILLGGETLMASSAHHSEEHLAEVGCEGWEPGPERRVLVGGLGMGYTLRAALDRVPPNGRVVVVELAEGVVRWNRGPLADLAGRPLEDPRTELVTGDIVDYIASRPRPFDAILLDTDNGPDDFTAKGNARLYDPPGLGRLRRVLVPGGRLVVWSAYECPAFLRHLSRAGFEARAVRAKSRGRKGSRHTLYVGRRPARRRRG